MSTTKKAGFAGLGASMIASSHAAPASESKPITITFHLNPELALSFDRDLFWLGRSATRRSLINDALAYYFANHPGARERIKKAAPDEDRQQ